MGGAPPDQTDCMSCWRFKDLCTKCANGTCNPKDDPDCDACWRFKELCHDCFQGKCVGERAMAVGAENKSTFDSVKDKIDKMSSTKFWFMILLLIALLVLVWKL